MPGIFSNGAITFSGLFESGYLFIKFSLSYHRWKIVFLNNLYYFIYSNIRVKILVNKVENPLDFLVRVD